MANVDIIIKSIDQTKAGFASAKSGLGGLSNEIALGIGKFEVYSQIIQKVGQTLADVVNDTIAYADEVRRLGEITGLSAEESSRLIQVSDDLKISTEDLTKAQKKLTSEGLSLSIETLAQLSDQYRAIQDPAEKAAFLTDKFGKAGYKFAEAMQKGGSALKEMNDSISDNLVLTQDSVDAAREYEKSIDDLQDTFMGLKVTVGNAVIPVLDDLVGGMNDFIKIQDDANKLMETGENTYRRAAIAQATIEEVTRRNAEASNSAANSYKDWAQAIEETSGSLGNLGTDLASAEEAMKEMTETNKGFLSLLGTMQSADESYNEKSKSLTEERIQLESDRAAALAAGWWEGSEKILEYDQKLEENKQKTIENADEFDLQNKRIMLGYIERQLTADGTLTDTELQWLLEKGVAWGVYSQTVVNETAKAIEEANKLAEAINTIPSERTFLMSVLVQGADAVGGLGSGFGQWGGGKALGGSVSGGTSYMVGEHGPERFTPNTSGTITPNGGGLDTTRIVEAIERNRTNEDRIVQLFETAIQRIMK